MSLFDPSPAAAGDSPSYWRKLWPVFLVAAAASIFALNDRRHPSPPPESGPDGGVAGHGGPAQPAEATLRAAPADANPDRGGAISPAPTTRPVTNAPPLPPSP